MKKITLISTSFGSIRPWTNRDADTLVKYANNPNVAVNLRDAFPNPYTRQSAKAFLKMVDSQEPVTFFAIDVGDEAVGGIGVSPGRDVHRLTAELGYWLGEPFWGRGIMTESVLKFCDYAFDRYSLMRIFAEPYAENQGSCRVLEKAGFELEGRLKSSVIKNGRIMDQFMYSKIRSMPPTDSAKREFP
jgi:[ribosomal protein S5]-alanine N-acetyltransferase